MRERASMRNNSWRGSVHACVRYQMQVYFSSFFFFFCTRCISWLPFGGRCCFSILFGCYCYLSLMDTHLFWWGRQYYDLPSVIPSYSLLTLGPRHLRDVFCHSHALMLCYHWWIGRGRCGWTGKVGLGDRWLEGFAGGGTGSVTLQSHARYLSAMLGRIGLLPYRVYCIMNYQMRLISTGRYRRESHLHSAKRSDNPFAVLLATYGHPPAATTIRMAHHARTRAARDKQ